MLQKTYNTLSIIRHGEALNKGNRINKDSENWRSKRKNGMSVFYFVHKLKIMLHFSLIFPGKRINEANSVLVMDCMKWAMAQHINCFYFIFI